MYEEIEIKLKVADHDAVRTRLKGSSASGGRAVLETNHLFDRPDGSLRAAGCGLRIRKTVSSAQWSVAGEKTVQRMATLTFKGPVAEGPFKRREEIEFDVSDGEAARSLLFKLGYVETLVFEKRREEWRLDGCTIELDEVPHLGRFVEIEGPTEQAIGDMVARLSLSASAVEPRTYVALLAEYAAARGLDPLAIRFGPPPP